ncbi:hypothetical protein Tco_0290794 [Tanacetum coccineum]
MAYLSEDIQSAGSDTRPPMLDRSDFASWQQRIRLYCQGKDNGENILKSIDEGPFKMRRFRETLAEGEEVHNGGLLLNVRVDRIEVKGIMLKEQLQLGMGEFRIEWAMQILAQVNGAVLDEEQILFIAGGQTSTFDDDVDEEPVQDLAISTEDKSFQADNVTLLILMLIEAPTTQTSFIGNLSSANTKSMMKLGPSYDFRYSI